MIDTAVFEEAEKRMTKTLEALQRDFSGVRTGRATPALVERIPVEAYGQEMPLKQLASISVPEPRLLVVQPWDKSQLGAIERAILKSDLGIHPTNDGVVIRLAFPPLTEERRKDLVRMVRRMAEDGRVAVRNIRRDAIDEVKKMEGIREDEVHRAQDQIQKLTDRFTGEIDRALEIKEKEIMEV